MLNAPVVTLQGIKKYGSIQYPERMLYEIFTEESKLIQGFETVKEQSGYDPEDSVLIGYIIYNMMIYENCENAARAYLTSRADYVLNGSKEDNDREWKFNNDRLSIIYSSPFGQRHHKWMPKIKELLSPKNSCLFAVGAMHLVGPKGLVKRLLDEGYRLHRINKENQHILVTAENYHLPFVKDAA